MKRLFDPDLHQHGLHYSCEHEDDYTACPGCGDQVIVGELCNDAGTCFPCQIAKETK